MSRETRRGERVTSFDGRSSPRRSDPARRLLPLLPAGLLALVALVPRVADEPRLRIAVLGAAAFLVLWHVLLLASTRGAGREWGLETVLRPQHYLQATVQIAVLAYWGWYWRPVYDFAWLIAAQLLFAYGFDLLLSWTRRDRYVLGFGPFPIILSINLFLWFRDDWFFLQFLMVGVGFLGKEFVRWQRGGRSVHIFNPSAFSLGLFSVALIALGASDITWGREIASTLTLAPHIYLYLFLLGLIVMYFFSITLVAGFAAATLFGLSALYWAWTGVPWFLDSEIPAAVFLGLHLLITDPSTSPRTRQGKALFGVLYGVGVFVLYALLRATGTPTFYDKLLCVPILNLSVRAIDHWMPSLDRVHGWARATKLVFDRPNLAHMTAWIGFFALMALGGRTDGMHTGDRVPFWLQACEEGRPQACERLLEVESTYCADNSAWACNELGNHYQSGLRTPADPGLARGFYARACELRFQPACENLLRPGALFAAAPKVLDLRLLVREGGGNLMTMPEPDLMERACRHGWTYTCRAGAAAP